MSRTRIVAVDDDRRILRVLKRACETVGYEVHSVLDAEFFESSFRVFEPSLVFLDLSMNNIDGVELLGENLQHVGNPLLVRLHIHVDPLAERPIGAIPCVTRASNVGGKGRVLSACPQKDVSTAKNSKNVWTAKNLSVVRTAKTHACKKPVSTKKSKEPTRNALRN